MVIMNTASNMGLDAAQVTITEAHHRNSNEMLDDGMDGDGLGSSDDDCGGDDYDDGSYLTDATANDEVTAQLAAAGPVGMAAAAAIASAKKRKRPHSFETNPSIRRRQQTRLLRKLRQTIDEYSTRVGQQAIVLVATPGTTQNNYKVFGAKPLEDVVKNLKAVIIQELETALAQHAPPPIQEDPSLHELPPLVIDGIPTPVEQMTQAQLRAFIPLMLKYSTGRGKPGWGKESTKPPWWPADVPWANVRMDARLEDDKQKISWTHALRQIVINCYRYHGREDLLPAFNEEESKNSGVKHIKVEESSTEGQTVLNSNHFTPSMIQTVTNPDGTVSIIQMDPSQHPIITLPDGTQAQVQGVATFVPSSVNEAGGMTLSAINGPDGAQLATMDLSSVTESGITEGHILLTGEDGQTYPVSISGMVTVPAMYQTMLSSMAQLQGNGDIQRDGKQICVTTPVIRKN
ncbi:DNA-binding protein P3A2-like isoform X2 [Artemia franciscana]|uniref:Nuclear respiratory factor 1 NLS/DNA-binding dimerisation domain-containing protein n=1 Tax=Artemia franciscana TaxID=6661 RepID=A0AA88IHT7_ARTSF|nr:hypothetical protein QYM36_003344 [Artemia franciscana]KAK2721024.1 hypothetical protein QYM36_003344 [Artemia franciscana]